MNFSSKLIEEAVNAFSSLPGIGKKSALRLVLHLLNNEEETTQKLVAPLIDMRKNIKTCQVCHNISDDTTCSICNDDRRDHSTVCIVENLRDLMAIEQTGQFRGVFHILGGVISPIDGIGPEHLNLASLTARIDTGMVNELIMAVSPTIEGETTIYYLSKQYEGKDVKISTIARGVSFGGELEYADQLTLGRSIVSRIPYKTE